MDFSLSALRQRHNENSPYTYTLELSASDAICLLEYHRHGSILSSRDACWHDMYSISGCPNIDDVFNRALYGDFDLLAEFKALRQSAKLIELVGIQSPKRQRKLVECGDEINIDRYLDRAELCMYSRVQSKQTNLIKLYIANAAVAGIEQKHYSQRGFAVLSIIEALEAKGFSVELNFVYPVKSSSASCRIIICFKQAHEYIDPAVMAFWTSSQYAQRMIGFALLEVLKNGPTVSGWGSASLSSNDPIIAPDLAFFPRLDYCLEKSQEAYLNSSIKIITNALRSSSRMPEARTLSGA